MPVPTLLHGRNFGLDASFKKNGEEEKELDVGPSLSQRGEQRPDQSLQDSRYMHGSQDDFYAFKAEQRALLEKKAATAKRIESMKREFDFISKMDAQDVNYVLNKKKEHAALLIQRNFSRQK